MVDRYFSFSHTVSGFEEIVGTTDFHSFTDAITMKANFEKYSNHDQSKIKHLVVHAHRPTTSKRIKK
jgi:hypothetical protein